MKTTKSRTDIYEYLLFDLDGTLTDPFEGITNSVEYALNKYGITVSDKGDLKKFIGPPLTESFIKYYGFDAHEADRAVSYYREYYSVKGIFENAVFDGIPSVLDMLKRSGKKLILATSKPERFAEIILKHFDLARFFDAVAGATMDSSRVKKADVISYALRSCEITDKSKAIMIGDREHDVFGAKINGLKSIGVLFGYGTGEELERAGADYIAACPQDISDIIL